MGWRSAPGVAFVLLAGCGGPGELSAAEQQQAGRTLSTYAEALARRNGDMACASLTRGMRSRHGDCPRRIAQQARLLEFGRPFSVRLTPVLQDDGSARAVVRYRSEAGISGGEVTLRRQGGRWLIDEDLTCLTPGCDP